MTLHLYNALKQRGLIVDDNLPVLATIDIHFQSCTGVWNGWRKPELEKFVYRLYLSFGADHQYSTYQQNRYCQLLSGGPPPTEPKTNFARMRKGSRIRATDGIDVVEISQCYRRMVMYDFNDCDKDNFMNHYQRNYSRLPIEYQEFKFRMVKTFECLFEENDFLLMNLPAIGELFKTFLTTLLPVEEDTAARVKAGIVRNRARIGKTMDQGEPDFVMFHQLNKTRDMLGKLDCLEDISEMSAVADKFLEYFRGVDQGRLRLDSVF